MRTLLSNGFDRELDIATAETSYHFFRNQTPSDCSASVVLTRQGSVWLVIDGVKAVELAVQDTVIALDGSYRRKNGSWRTKFHYVGLSVFVRGAVPRWVRNLARKNCNPELGNSCYPPRNVKNEPPRWKKSLILSSI